MCRVSRTPTWYEEPRRRARAKPGTRRRRNRNSSNICRCVSISARLNASGSATRKIRVTGCMSRSARRPITKCAPPRAAMSPSPVASTKARPGTISRPPLFATRTPRTRPPSTSASTQKVWRRKSTPLSTSISNRTCWSANGSAAVTEPTCPSGRSSNAAPTATRRANSSPPMPPSARRPPPGGLARRHAGSLVPCVDVGVVVDRDAPARDQQPVDVLRHQAAVGDLVHEHPGHQRPRLHVLRAALLAIGRVASLLARVLLVGIHRNHVVVAPPGEDVVLGHHVGPPNAPRLPHPDGARGVEDERALEAGDVLAREGGELQHLVSRLDLRPRQVHGVRAVQSVDAGGVDGQHAALRQHA